METTVKERLALFIKAQGISVNKFEKMCGFSTGYVANMRKSLQPDKIMSIVQNFPMLNTGWLLTGEGEMLKEVRAEFCLTDAPHAPEDKIKDLEHTIELLKRDVKYYADIADIRLQTIEVQTKLIVELEKGK